MAGRGVLPGGVVRAWDGEGLHRAAGAVHQRGKVNARAGDGQQSHGGEDGIAAAHRVGHHEFLVALRVRQALEGPPAGVGGGIDTAPRLFLAVFLLQKGF